MVSLKTIFGLLIFILFFHVLATVNYWYWTYTWFDMPMHFLGGFWVAMVYFWLRQKCGLTRMDTQINVDNISVNRRSNQRLSALLMIISSLGFVALIGVLWEFFEFLCDLFVLAKGYSWMLQQGAADTLSDLFFDLLGGVFLLIVYRFKNVKIL